MAAAGVLLLLSSCVKTDVDLTVRSDDVVDGSIIMAVDRSFSNGNDKTQTALIDALRDRVFPATRSGASQEPYSDGQYVGTRVVINHMTLLDLDRSTGANGLKIVHQGGRFRLSGKVDTSELTSAAATSSPQDAQRLRDSYDVMVRITFPGPVVSTNGSVSGNTVTWRPRLGQQLNLSAVAEDGKGGIPWVWLLAAGAVLAVATAIALGRSRRVRTPVDPNATPTNRRLRFRVRVEVGTTND